MDEKKQVGPQPDNERFTEHGDVAVALVQAASNAVGSGAAAYIGTKLAGANKEPPPPPPPKIELPPGVDLGDE